ncbi:MAG: hypothetical protein Q9228_006672, partial [Teloschistes exilis]
MSPANILLSLYLFLLTSAFHIYASPINQPSLTQAPPPLNATRPPKTPVCPFTLGHPTRMIFFKQYCELAIAKIPRDIRPSSPRRNFYLLPQDRSRSMNNQLLPLEWEEGDCVIQLLMAASFRDIPHDTATWMDIWGPARLILQQCITPRRGGGIITHIGDGQKMDLVIFSKASTYAATR